MNRAQLSILYERFRITLNKRIKGSSFTKPFLVPTPFTRGGGRLDTPAISKPVGR